jgi:transposase
MLLEQLKKTNDIEKLRAEAMSLIAMQASTIDHQKKIIEDQRKQLEEVFKDKQASLEIIEQVQLLNKKIYSRSSEKTKSLVPTVKLNNNFELVSEETKEGSSNSRKQELPTEEVIHTLAEDDKACDACNSSLTELKNQYEESTEITIVERTFKKIIHKRQKYVCKCGECIKTAQAPLKLIEGGRYSIDFGIEVAVAKYADHMPLERQAKVMEREGLDIKSQTLWDQIQAVSHYLKPVYNKIYKEVLNGNVLHIDETRWEMLHKDPERWQLWGVCNNTSVYYDAVDTRGAKQVTALLEGYEGIVVSDAFESYKCANKTAKWISAGCWAHARRKFKEAEANYPTECVAALTLINNLFEIENKAKNIKELKLLRETESKVTINQIQDFLNTTKALPSSQLAKAIGYSQNNWKELTVFLDYIQVPLTNNAAERALRGPVVGRKNHYGSKSERGAQASSILYSIMESCKLNKINAVKYLKHVLPLRLQKQEAPTPAEYATTLAI